MESKIERSDGAMSAIGSHNTQVQGNLAVTNDYSVMQILYVLPRPTNGQDVEAPEEQKLSLEERAQLSIWTDEIVHAESGLVSSKIIRAALNAHLGVKSVTNMTADMFGRATVFLQGWRNCAAGKDLSPEAMIAQILRIWTIVPGLRGTIVDFTKAAFQREMLKSMSTWELKSTLAFSMTRWQAYWEQRNA